MRSIKPGRGPSAMGGAGALFAALFGILWTAMAISMGAPIFFLLFGVFFVIMGIVQAAYHFKNATGKNRFSVMDITDGTEEKDPWDECFGKRQGEAPDGAQDRFCPYCGAAVQKDFSFCGHCGKELPR